MNPSITQFEALRNQSNLGAKAIKAARSKKQQTFTAHHVPNLDEQLKFAKLMKLLESPTLGQSQS